uniref:hypothetical protein n=1 Tax=Herbidospora sakaeratensis TaxID=564415 RepID=UPI0012FB3AD2|nr:hypothetical protein [Herbidospora sakaeratensis]
MNIGTAPADTQAGVGEAARPVPGRLPAEVTDPFEHQLEIHRAIDTGSGAAGFAAPADLAALPVYVPRAHDQALAQVFFQAADGGSRIAVLVGGPPPVRPVPAGKHCTCYATDRGRGGCGSPSTPPGQMRRWPIWRESGRTRWCG